MYTTRIISLVRVLQRARVITRRRSRIREINPRYSISLTINQNGNYCYAFTASTVRLLRRYSLHVFLVTRDASLSIALKMINRSITATIWFSVTVLCTIRLDTNWFLTAAFVSLYIRIKWQDIMSNKLCGASRKIRKEDLPLSSKKTLQYRSNYFTDDLRFTTVLYFVSRRMKILLNVRVARRHVKVLITRRIMGFRASLPSGSRRARDNASLSKQTRTTTVWSEYESIPRRAKPAPCELKRAYNE